MVSTFYVTGMQPCCILLNNANEICHAIQILDLPVKTERNLTAVMDAVYGKATLEPLYTYVTYATYAVLFRCIAGVS